MQKKFLFITLLIIIICFSFTITSFASTDYSVVYPNDNSLYCLYIDFKKQTDFDLPTYDSRYIVTYGSSSNIYFALMCDKDPSTGLKSNYRVASSKSPFVIISEPSFDVFIKSDSPIVWSFLKTGNDGSQYWEYGKSGSLSSVLYGEVLMCSDNLSYNGEIIFYKYTKSPLARTFQKLDTKNTAMKEILLLLPVVLVVIVGFIGVRKGINFIKRKTQKA